MFKAEIEKLEKQITGLEYQKNLLIDTIAKKEKSLKELSIELGELESCADFFNNTISEKVSEVSERIEQIINQGLAFVYGGEYSFRLNKSIKRNKTTFNFELLHGETGVSGFEETHGGGIMALISFLFRVIVITILNRPRIIMLDETLSAVSVEYQDRLSQFIRQLCNEMDFTIILISHQPTLTEKANIKLRVSKFSKNTFIKRIKD